ncbi:MAG: hypothetical protein ABSB79_13070 [Syntrophales bacterium]
MIYPPGSSTDIGENYRYHNAGKLCRHDAWDNQYRDKASES